MFKKPNPRQSFPEMERNLADHWKSQQIFARSVESRPKDKEYTFYDGPPFATGLPHYGHILSSTMKDMVPRYWTMRGYRVQRRWGWDCHGLPIEYEKEKELGITSKQGIEEYGIANFNEACRSTVMRYSTEWKEFIHRMGRFVDMENDYKTLEPWYMESVWWVFKELWKKGLVYEGYKVVPYCLRCATSLSNFEAALEYQDTQDKTVTVKFLASSFRYKDDTPTYFLAWTTTPWTLPSNMALVVGPEVVYVLVKDATTGEQYILGKETLSKYYPQKDGEEAGYELLQEFSGEELAGLAYDPIFPYYEDKRSSRAFTVYTADYVTADSGTGIVHQAPYGEDDFALLKEKGIEVHDAISDDGYFIDPVTDFEGQFIFDANKSIITHLKESGALIRQETMQHSYPHCWRCDSPLIYKPISTWFVATTDIKQDLLDNNKKINWTPNSVKEGRFGKWLENVRDWGVSRNRYWGTPLPIWRCTDCEDLTVVGSVEELWEKKRDRFVRVVLMRHGEGEHNVSHIWSSDRSKYHLTDQGRRKVKDTAQKQIDEVDVIIHSPVLRTVETAEIVHETLGGKSIMVADERLTEMAFGAWEDICYTDSPYSEELYEWRKRKGTGTYWTTPRASGSESFEDVEKRVVPFAKELVTTYAGKTVVVVTHGAVNLALQKILSSLSVEKAEVTPLLETAGAKEFYIDVLTGKELDLHKHIMDEFDFPCDQCEGGTKKRISEIFDCWFESGSMPYAQNHFPFENKDYTASNFPADFIAEGADQTRGWFYTLHVLATALSDGKSGLGMYHPAFKNVIVNGIVLAEDGKKMSKRLKNYPDPMVLMDTHGADAMRFYLMNSPVVHGEDLRFSERGVDEVVKKVLLPLWNSFSFFVTYANLDGFTLDKKVDLHTVSNTLDKWILSKTQTVLRHYHDAMERYDLRTATAEMSDFIDALTNWYIRRSRRRFWKSENDGEKMEAYSVLHEVLVRFAEMIAPVTPFIAEEIYTTLTDEESVHLAEFSEVDQSLIDESLEIKQGLVRLVVKLGHSIRAKQKLKVRQPLALLEIALPQGMSPAVLDDNMDVIAEELNVKEVRIAENPEDIGRMVVKPNAKVLGPIYGGRVQEIIKAAKAGEFEVLPNGNIKVKLYELTEDQVEVGYESKEGYAAESEGGMVVVLDTVVTDELALEGLARDLVRYIQDQRKDLQLDVSARITVSICEVVPGTRANELLTHYMAYITEETLADKVYVTGSNAGEKEVALGEGKVTISIETI